MRTITMHDALNGEENIRIYRHVHTQPETDHIHEFFEIAYIYSGCGNQTINDKSFFVQRGDLMIFDFKDKHSFVPTPTMGVLNILINPSFLGKELSNSFDWMDILLLSSFSSFRSIDAIPPLFKFSTKRYYFIESIFEAMEAEFNERETGYEGVIRCYLEILFMKILREIKSHDSVIPQNIEKLSPEILEYIQKNYNKKISLKDLAQQNFLSPSYFSTVFKECYGITLTDYINQTRINKAILMLTETDLSAEEIAVKVGYTDKKNFYTIFKHITGKTPGAYRKNTKKS